MTCRNPAAIGAFAKGDLENFLAAATPGGIEAQEARGQQTLVNNSNLPVKCRDRAPLEAAGVIFGEPLSGNESIFCKATLPSGWRKKATDHAMWSDLVDDKGRKRASIFFKAAFYDYNAHMRAECRFNVAPYEDGSDDKHYRLVVKDGERVAYICGEYEKAYSRESDKVCTALIADAEKWLIERYPDYKNPAAYWDDL